MSADSGPSSPQSGNRDEWSAWESHFRASAAARNGARDQHQIGRTRPVRRRARLRDLAAPLLVLMLLSVPVALAAPSGGEDNGQVGAARGEGDPLELAERNPSSGGLNRVTSVVADTATDPNQPGSGLVLRPSNTAKGGRAISATCDNDGTAPEDGCAVYVNKGSGAAATFRTKGSVPFAIRDTNNGRVDHLNADRVDDLHASEIIGQARAKNGLDADTVDGFHANTLIRSAFAEEDADALDGTDGTVLTTTIEAPTSGFLFITSGTDAVNFTSRDAARCFLEVNDKELPESERWIELNGTENVNQEENCTTQGVEQVAAGTHKVDFEGADLGTFTEFDEATLQVLFIPFGADGSTP